MRRAIQTDDDQRTFNELFLEQLHYLPKSNKALTLQFIDGGRVYDAGNSVTVHGMAHPFRPTSCRVVAYRSGGVERLGFGFCHSRQR